MSHTVREENVFRQGERSDPRFRRSDASEEDGPEAEVECSDANPRCVVEVFRSWVTHRITHKEERYRAMRLIVALTLVPIGRSCHRE